MTALSSSLDLSAGVRVGRYSHTEEAGAMVFSLLMLSTPIASLVVLHGDGLCVKWLSELKTMLYIH